MKKLIPLALLACAATLSLPAAAQFAKPEDAIKYREAVMTVQGFHLGRLFAMAQGKIPFDAKVAASDADVLADVTRLAWPAFLPGTDKGKTRAKPDIWTEQAKFKEAADKMQAEVAKLDAAAKTGNLDNIKAAVGPVGQSCKACHDNFRKD